jgi:glutathione synthase/RimK-type ligase-like ATP-grasp enzyme
VTLEELLRDACASLGVEVTALSQGWLLVLRRDGRTHVVLGQVFPFNTAAAGELCDDKCALADFLALTGVPHVPHHHVTSHRRNADGTWRPGPASEVEALAALDRLGVRVPVVVKPVRGRNGRDVRLAATLDEAAAHVTALLEHEGMAAVSPYVEIRNELRVVLLDGEPLCVLDKVRGDDWRHNLRYGARAVPLAAPPAGAVAVARAAADAVGLRLATVDCVLVGDEWLVLEANTGTKLTAWAAQSEADRAAATEVYRRIVAALVA